jgi:hypothetical protein
MPKKSGCWAAASIGRSGCPPAPCGVARDRTSSGSAPAGAQVEVLEAAAEARRAPPARKPRRGGDRREHGRRWQREAARGDGRARVLRVDAGLGGGHHAGLLGVRRLRVASQRP